jgi:O-acetylserine/cysteine efflux transporter
MSIRDICLAFLVVMIWGLNFSIIKIGLEELPPILFSALRFALVALPAVFFVPFPKTSIWNVVGVGVFLGVLKFGCLFVAMKSDASAGLSSLLLQAQVFFTIGFSVLFYKEHITKSQLLGVIIASLGFSLFFVNAGQNITYVGLILILLAAFFWSISNLIMKKIKDVNLLHFMVWVCLIPPLPLLFLSYVTETSDPVSVILSTSLNTWSALVYVSLVSTLVAFAIWGKLLKSYASIKVAPFALLIPVIGIIASNIILDESLSLIEYAGGILIMLGLIFCVLGGKLISFVAVGYKHLARAR